MSSRFSRVPRGFAVLLALVFARAVVACMDGVTADCTKPGVCAPTGSAGEAGTVLPLTEASTDEASTDEASTPETSTPETSTPETSTPADTGAADAKGDAAADG